MMATLNAALTPSRQTLKNPALLTPKMDSKDVLDSVIYNYATTLPQMEYENKLLKETANQLKLELERFKKPPLMVCEVVEVIGGQAVIRVPNGNLFLVGISKDAGTIQPGDSVLTEQKNLTVLQKLSTSKKFDVEKFVIIEKPDMSWAEIGGLGKEAEQIKEVIELPLKKPELFRKVGISPPKGILLHGPPGTGKTLLAKAVASSTQSTFIEIVGSELVQKFIGEGAKLVKEIFQLAKERAPSIIFIDEIDAIAGTRIEIGTSGEREVQRTFMQLLAEIDGFKPLGNVKIIGCTNRKDILDPAILRPGRLDRMIKIHLPNKDQRSEIFTIHTQRMQLSNDIDREKILRLMEGFSGAEIKAVATEAGYVAIRNNRTRITEDYFLEAIEKVRAEESEEFKHMFG